MRESPGWAGACEGRAQKASVQRGSVLQSYIGDAPLFFLRHEPDISCLFSFSREDMSVPTQRNGVCW